MTILILISTFVVIWLANSITFDGIIRYQFEEHYDEWVEDGKPRGMFFNPKGSSTLAFWKASYILSKERPVWVDEDAKALSTYNKYVLTSKISMWYMVLLFPLLILGKCAKI